MEYSGSRGEGGGGGASKKKKKKKKGFKKKKKKKKRHKTIQKHKEGDTISISRRPSS